MAAAATLGRIGSWPPTTATAKARRKFVTMFAATFAGNVTGRVKRPPSPVTNPAPKLTELWNWIIEFAATCMREGESVSPTFAVAYRAANFRAPSNCMSSFPRNATHSAACRSRVAVFSSFSRSAQNDTVSATASATARDRRSSAAKSRSARSFGGAKAPSLDDARFSEGFQSDDGTDSGAAEVSSVCAFALRSRNFAARTRVFASAPSGSASVASAKTRRVSESASASASERARASSSGASDVGSGGDDGGGDAVPGVSTASGPSAGIGPSSMPSLLRRA